MVYDGINEEVSVEENDVLVKFLHPTDPSVYLHWPAIEVKSWVPVYHRLQLLSIPTVNFSGCPYTFTGNPKFYPLTNRKLFFNFKQFHHHWKLLKTLDFNTYQGFLFFVLYTVIPGYFSEFIYEIIKCNISKIKHHSYEVF